MSCIEKATPPPPQERHLYNPPDCLRFISVSIEFFPNHYSCKVNSSLCTKNEQLVAMLNNVGLNNVLSPTCSMFSTILFSNFTLDSVITILFNIVDNYKQYVGRKH